MRLRVLVWSVVERERRTGTNWCARMNGGVARWHNTLDGGLVAVIVETTAFDVRAQRADVVPFFLMIRLHVLISHPTSFRRLQAEVSKNGEGPADRRGD